MAKNIIIQEGGVDKRFTTSRIRTKLDDGVNTCDWIPLDEINDYIDITLGQLNADSNGVFLPENFGLDGFDRVVINVSGGYDENTVYATLNTMSFGTQI